MAKITPIDVIKGISGKYGSGSNDYFATNKSSNKVRLAKLINPYHGPATEKQLAQQARFAARQAVATAWLNANKPSETNGSKGTALYQQVQKMKRAMCLSDVNQVLYRYMDESNVIRLPDGSTFDQGTSGEKVTLTLSASPSEGGTVSGAGQYAKGAAATISATAAGGYTFSRWSDGNTNAQRTLTLNADMALTATFTATGAGSGEEEGEGGGIGA